MNRLKKNLGAGVLSLALLVGGGLHNLAFAVDEIAVNPGSGSPAASENFSYKSGHNADNSDPEHPIEAQNPTSTANIRGWQTEIPTGYAVNVTWGDMIFVYDRGAFDPATGTLSRATHAEGDTNLQQGETPYTGIEIGATEGQVNKWYGFNGTKNKVTVENLSTGAITFGAAVTQPNNQASIIGQAQASLYKKVAKSNAEDTGLDVKGHLAGEGFKFETISQNPVSSTEFSLAAPTRNSISGEVSDPVPSDNVYVNLSGEPGSDLAKLGVAASPSVIGTITLTFAKAVQAVNEGP